MKKASILIVFVAGWLTLSAQDSEVELKDRILKLEHSQEQMKVALQQSHKKFSTGTLFIIGGMTTILTSGLIYVKQSGNTDAWDNGKLLHPTPVLLYIGGGLVTTGAIIQIDSHKWIGRAGRRSK